MRFGTFRCVPRRAAGCLLVGAALVLGAGGCGSQHRAHQADADVTPAPLPTPSAARRHEARQAIIALKRHGALIAGVIDPSYVGDDAECTARIGGIDLIDCNVAEDDDAEDPTLFVVRIERDGTLTKQLGQAQPVAGPKSSAQTAALLAADDRLQHARSRSRPYACHPAPQLAPSGRPTGTGATGQLCSTYLRVAKMNVERYVQFAPDGMAQRDYELRPG